MSPNLRRLGGRSDQEANLIEIRKHEITVREKTKMIDGDNETPTLNLFLT